MFITIENNKCVVNLDETEFPVFQAMFANLHNDKHASVEFRRFPDFGGTFQWSFLPMHLCRTIGEGRQGPTANGFGQKILPRKIDCSGPSQASILSAGFSWKDSSTTERIP